jgi:hypothetical protein
LPNPKSNLQRNVQLDYGATVRIGSRVIEYTHSYCLDANVFTAAERLDWICLGTTLAQIVGFDIFEFERASQLVDEIYFSTKDEKCKNLIVSCLENLCASDIESALHQLE